MLEIIVKRDADLTAEESAQVDLVDHLAFSGMDDGVEDLESIEWSSAEWVVLGLQDGKIVSLLNLLYREVRVGDQVIPVAGVGGVCTHPDWQRHGFAGEVLERATAFMRDEMNVPFGLLVCSSAREQYYAKFGWRTIRDPMLFDQQGVKRVFPDKTMILPLTGRSWPAGTVDLCGNPW